MAVVSSSTKENRLVKYMTLALGTSRKNLPKHRKFRLKIDVNDEFTCWEVICKKPYKYRLGEDVKKIIYEYLMKNSCVSPKERDVMRRRITRNEYEEMKNISWTPRKTLHKHRQFRLQIYVNDEITSLDSYL